MSSRLATSFRPRIIRAFNTEVYPLLQFFNRWFVAEPVTGNLRGFEFQLFSAPKCLEYLPRYSL
jgi:hypothetical protein